MGAARGRGTCVSENTNGVGVGVGLGSGLAIPHSGPNNPVERTAYSARFLAISCVCSCGPPLTGSVRLCYKMGCGNRSTWQIPSNLTKLL
jgi:hypothetical protein